MGGSDGQLFISLLGECLEAAERDGAGSSSSSRRDRTPCREGFLGLRDEDSQVLFMLGTLHQQHRMHGDVNMYEILPYVSEKAVFARVRCNLCGGERACVLFYVIIHG